MYAPQLGRFISRDPIGYINGMNVFEYVRSNPSGFVDPSGLICCGAIGQALNSFTHENDYVIPGVQICDGYIADGGLWGVVSSHEYVLIDGVGYGFYANSHVGGPPDAAGGIGVIYTKGKVVTGDETKYPPVTTVPKSGTYAICKSVVIENGLCDPDGGTARGNAAKAAIIKDAKAAVGVQQTYGAGTQDCFWWAGHLVVKNGAHKSDESPHILVI